MTVGYDELGGALLERLRICVERRMPIDEIIPQMLDTCEAYIACNYGEVMASRARFVHGAILLRCTNVLADTWTPGLSVNAQDAYDRNLMEMADKIAKRCKRMPREAAFKNMYFDVNKLIAKYMTITTGILLDASCMAYQMTDYAMHVNLVLIDIENEGIGLEKIFSYGDEGDMLRARLTADACNCGCAEHLL